MGPCVVVNEEDWLILGKHRLTLCGCLSKEILETVSRDRFECDAMMNSADTRGRCECNVAVAMSRVLAMVVVDTSGLSGWLTLRLSLIWTKVRRGLVSRISRRCRLISSSIFE